LDDYDFEKKFITFVKNENANFNVMISKQKSMMNYELFHLDESFHGILNTMLIWGGKKNAKKFKYVYIESTQFYLQKCIT